MKTGRVCIMMLVVVLLLVSVAVAAAKPEKTQGNAAAPKPEAVAELLSALSSLKDHIQGKNKLDARQIEAQKLTLDKHQELFGCNAATIKAALALVAAYDKIEGPLWVARGIFIRKDVTNDIHWTIYTVMQNIMDHIYTAENVARHADLLKGFKFGSSANFPGAVDPPARPDASYKVKISGNYPKTWGWPTMYDGPGTFARKPTGAYLAPGTFATVTVPPSLVGKGYKIRVGCHSWDLSKTEVWKLLRLDRSSLVYDITHAKTTVASPLGGGIYIEVPFLADAGVVEVTIQNAVRSPYFSMKPFHTTSLEEWKTVERNLPAPWADFQTEKFMMQVPSSWIRKLDDPVTLMQDWDAAVDAITDLEGFPRLRGKETLYPQVDVMMPYDFYAPGYPSVNMTYDPAADYGGYATHHLVRGPQYANYYELHEQGHCFLCPKFPGEVESVVNLLHVAAWNQKFGYSLDEAFRASSGGYEKRAYCTLDTTAMAWMTCANFIKGNPMEAVERQYQLKGHAKWVDIARLFGWRVLNNYGYSFTSDYEHGVPRRDEDIDNSGLKKVDSLLLRLSKSVGVDIRPLFHFWGVPPVDNKTLSAAMDAAKLPASPLIYDTLVHYQSLVPADNAAFRTFALNWWDHQPSAKGYTEENGHAALWEDYNEQTAAQIKQRVQEIIAKYFPEGRPREK